MTAAEHAILSYLVAAERMGSREFSGGSLVEFYRVRSGQAGYADSRRSGAWRRTGGRMLGRLAAAGMLRLVRLSHGVPNYVLTDEGRAAGKR